MNRKEVEERIILLALTGSRSYGIALKESDKDYKGIFIAPTEYYLGTKRIEQKDKGWREEGSGKFKQLDNNRDTVIYELSKYIKLGIKCNPNILELLYEDKKFLEYVSPLGQRLIDNRELFLSKKVNYSYGAYAYSQIKKVETHRKWILNPPLKKPEIKDYGLEKYEGGLKKAEINSFLEFIWILIRSRIEYLEEEKELYNFIKERIDIKGVLKNSILSKESKDYIQKITHSTDEFMSLLTKTQQYRKELDYWNNYESWKKNRNPKRAELERKIGYDSKNVAHAIRLLKTGHEILLTGKVNVNRENIDAKELIDIRLGKVNYDEVIKITDNLFNTLKDSCNKSKLPNNVDSEKIDNLLINIVKEYNNLK